MFGNKKLKAENNRLQALVEICGDELRKVRGSLWHFYSTYRFTDSDFNKFGNNLQGMQKEARQRMACALGRKIIKELKADEIIENGVLVGYKIDVEARKKEL